MLIKFLLWLFPVRPFRDVVKREIFRVTFLWGVKFHETNGIMYWSKGAVEVEVVVEGGVILVKTWHTVNGVTHLRQEQHITDEMHIAVHAITEPLLREWHRQTTASRYGIEADALLLK